jgi:hypothetical protein
MVIKLGASPRIENPVLMIFIAALIARVVTWLIIPIDWNWDSYHHWQISYFSLRIGFTQHRLWDLNGCEYLWGMIPHLVQAILLGVLHTTSITPYRVLNVILGSFNAVLVFKVGSRFYSQSTGMFSGLIYSIFPVATVFDTLAMQDTIALTFLLASLFLIKEKPFWAGLSLSLAGQSRTELMLVGLIIIFGYVIKERINTNSLPYLIGSFLGLGVFSFYVFTQTGNPFYSFYWSLRNVFGGWITGNESKTFLNLMLTWIIQKLTVWPSKPTGIVILLIGLTTIIFIPYMALKRLKLYQPQLYFLSTASVLTPIFITYLGSSTYNLLIMLRMINPIIALGAPLLIHLIEKETQKYNNLNLAHSSRTLLLALTIASSIRFLPSYATYQRYQTEVFYSANLVSQYYQNGTIVCDNPTINYCLINNAAIDFKLIIGNHYAPNYYGVRDPLEYAEWLHENNVSLWIYYDDQSETVWSVLSINYPDLLIPLNQGPNTRIYAVNQTLLADILS